MIQQADLLAVVMFESGGLLDQVLMVGQNERLGLIQIDKRGSRVILYTL